MTEQELPEPYLSAEVTASLLGPNVREPLFTASQLHIATAAARAPLLAEIERLRAERDAAVAALAELVKLKDLKDRLTQLHEMGHGTDYGTYHAGKAAAWSAARSVLAASPKEKT